MSGNLDQSIIMPVWKVRALSGKIPAKLRLVLLSVLFTAILFILYRNKSDTGRGRSGQEYKQGQQRPLDLFASVYGDDRYIMKSTDPINLIPPIFHFMWKDDEIPKASVDNLLAWRKFHPNWTFVFWTDDDIREAMKLLLPPQGLLDTYKKFNHHMMRIDFCRYAILYFIGGLYADIDVKPLKSLDSLLQYHSAVIAREPEAYSISTGSTSAILASNFLMASRPGHPYFAYLMEAIRHIDKPHFFWRAGPGAVTEALHNYMSELPLGPRDCTVFLAPSMYFDPPVIEKGDNMHISFLNSPVCPELLKKRDLPWYPRFICETAKREKRIDYSLGYIYPRYFMESFSQHSMFDTYGKGFETKEIFIPIQNLSLNLTHYSKLLQIHPVPDIYEYDNEYVYNRH